MLVALVVTFIANEALTAMWGPTSVMKGSVFNDYESFLEFAETDVPRPSSFGSNQQAGVAVRIAPESEATVYYDENGNAVSKDEALTRTIEDGDGNTVLEYVQRNGNVLSVSYSTGSNDGNILPITVYTYEDYREGRLVVQQRNAVFACIYVLEIIAAVIVYVLLRRKDK